MSLMTNPMADLMTDPLNDTKTDPMTDMMTDPMTNPRPSPPSSPCLAKIVISGQFRTHSMFFLHTSLRKTKFMM